MNNASCAWSPSRSWRVLLLMLRVVQANVSHRTFDIALIQEPWVHRGKIMDLGEIREVLIHNLWIRKRVNIMNNVCSRNLTVIKLKSTGRGQNHNCICLSPERTSGATTNQGHGRASKGLQSRRITAHNKQPICTPHRGECQHQRKSEYLLLYYGE